MYMNYKREAQFIHLYHGPILTSEITAFPDNLIRNSTELHSAFSSSQMRGNCTSRYDFRLSATTTINPLPLQPGKFIDPGYRW